jgi:phosphatidyl-myo-inositol alpha-mannosyltransferase
VKIAVVCPYDLGRPGGVQQLTSELVSRLEAEGHDAWLVGPGADMDNVGRTVRIRANASVVPISLARGVRKRTLARLREADVVHIHEPFIPMVSVAALGVSKPKVLTFHADAPGWVRPLYVSAGRLFDRSISASIVTAVSPVAARAIPERWGPVELIPNALDVSAYRDANVARIASRVTFLGRDDPRKGLDVLLEAWPDVVAAVPHAELVVAGARRDNAPGVEFLGRVDETQKRHLLASSAIHVAPNTGGESFGIVVAEAMAGGAAVVATDLPAFVSVMAGSGLHVPVGDSRALANALIHLLGSPEEVERMSEAGRDRVSAFDWPSVLRRYIDAYERAIRMDA